MDKKKILVLNHSFENFTGSEINALQLCQGLNSLGYQAEIGAFKIGKPLSDIAHSSNIRVLNLLTAEKERLDYDLIWAHHSPVLAHVLFKMNISDCRILYSCLSSIIPLEAPPTFHEEIPLFLTHSEKLTEIIIKNGVKPEKIREFPNFAPNSYFDKKIKNFSPTPKNIAVVSNHPPQEVIDFSKIARSHGIAINFIGYNSNPVYIEDKVLENYDLVITIGKTVNYCLALGVPVYCYDWFGGNGYINPDNFAINKRYVFSGRDSFRKLSGEAIFSEITQKYSENVSNLEYLRQQARIYFNLEKNLSELFVTIDKLPVMNISEFRENHSLDERIYDIFPKDRFEQARAIIHFYENSKSWKLTRPLRYFSRLIKRQESVTPADLLDKFY